MPPVIAYVAAYIVTATGVTLATATVLATLVVAQVASFALGKIAQALAGSKAGAPNISQTITAQGTLEARRIIYGDIVCSGVVTFFGVSSAGGSTQDYLWYVIALAGHQVESITDIYFDGDMIASAAINSSTGLVGSGKFANHANIWRLTGTSADAAQADLIAAFPALGSNFKGTGVAKLVIRMNRGSDVYTNGAPQNFRARVKGKRVYDPRLDSTNGGSGSQRLTDATTWTWSANPALCAADYFTGGSIYFDVATPLARLGMNIPPARVNYTYVAASANECDQTVSLPASATQARYVLGCALSCADIHDTNLNVILQSMMGQRIFSQGKYRIFAGQYDTPTINIGDNDLTVDGYTVAGTTAGTDLYNTVVANFYDPAQDWQKVQCAVRTQSTYVTADGGQTLLRTIDLSGVTDAYRAQRICEIVKKQSRNQIVVTLSLKLTGVKLAPWDTFYLSLAEQGWQNKVFRAQAIDMDLSNRRIVITAKEESSSPYADPLTTDYAAPGAAAPSSTAEGPDDPSGLVTAGQPYGITLFWNASPYFAPGSTYNLYEYTSSTPFASATLIASGLSTTSYFLNKTDAITRYYWVQAQNQAGNKSNPYPGVTGVAGATRTVDTGFLTTGAATDISETYVGSTTTYPWAGGIVNTFASQAISTLAFTSQISVTASFDAYMNSAGNSGDAYILVTWPSNSHIIDSIFGIYATVSAPGRYVLQGTISVPAGNAVTVALDGFGTSSSSITVANITLHVETIKR